MKIIVVSGGFDPIHSGHIRYLNNARLLGDVLIVGLNSDSWLQRKKGKEFMPIEERSAIVSNLKCVDDVITFDDSDNSAKDAIVQVRNRYPNAHLIFANGGDRTSGNIPEKELKITGQAPDPATIKSLAQLYIGPDFMGEVDVTEEMSGKAAGTYITTDATALIIVDEKGNTRLQKL